MNLNKRLETIKRKVEAIPEKKPVYNFEGIPLEDQRELRDFLKRVRTGVATWDSITPNQIETMKKAGFKFKAERGNDGNE